MILFARCQPVGCLRLFDARIASGVEQVERHARADEVITAAVDEVVAARANRSEDIHAGQEFVARAFELHFARAFGQQGALQIGPLLQRRLRQLFGRSQFKIAFDQLPGDGLRRV